MRCPLCADRGVIRIGYQEEPDGYRDFGVCSCARGQRFRTPDAMAALAAKFGVHPESVNLVEELLDPEDFPEPMGTGAAVPTLDVTEAGRVGKRARL